IARGPVADVRSVRASDFDAIVLPGGFGAAKNLCDFAVEGAACEVEPGVAKLLGDALELKKPIALACIAPTVLAGVLRDREESAELTIGTDEATAAALEAMGVVHVPCDVRTAHADPARPIVTA